MSDLERQIGEVFDIPPEAMRLIAEEAELARKVREAREAAYWASVARTVAEVNAYLSPYGLSISIGSEEVEG